MEFHFVYICSILSNTPFIGTEDEWRHPLLDMPTTLISRKVVQLFSIPTLQHSWHVQQGMAPLVLCPYEETKRFEIAVFDLNRTI